MALLDRQTRDATSRRRVSQGSELAFMAEAYLVKVNVCVASPLSGELDICPFHNLCNLVGRAKQHISKGLGRAAGSSQAR